MNVWPAMALLTPNGSVDMPLTTATSTATAPSTREEKPTPVEPVETPPRELLIAYHDDPATLETVLAGITADHGLLQMFYTLVGQESDAWLLSKLGMLPDWWHLISAVHARNLSNGDLVEHPAEDAEQRLSELSHVEQARIRTGWLVLRTKAGGVIYRRLDQTPIVRDPAFVAVLKDFPVKVLGPHSDYK